MDGAAFAREAVEAEKKSQTYVDEYYESEEENSALFEFDTDFLDKLFVKKGRLLDAMMGRGRHVLHFSERGFDVYGNDYNQHMADAVRKDLISRGLRAKISSHNAVSMPFKDGMFDYVICMYASLGCVPSREGRAEVLREFARVTKPGGLVVLHGHSFVGSVGSVLDMEDTIQGLLPPKGLDRGDHVYIHEVLGKAFVHFFMPGELTRAVRRAGLEISDVQYVHKTQKRLCTGPLSWMRGVGVFVVARKP